MLLLNQRPQCSIINKITKKGRHKRRPFSHKGEKFEMDRSKCPVAKILVYINSK